MKNMEEIMDVRLSYPLVKRAWSETEEAIKRSKVGRALYIRGITEIQEWTTGDNLYICFE